VDVAAADAAVGVDRVDPDRLVVLGEGLVVAIEPMVDLGQPRVGRCAGLLDGVR